MDAITVAYKPVNQPIAYHTIENEPEPIADLLGGGIIDTIQINRHQSLLLFVSKDKQEEQEDFHTMINGRAIYGPVVATSIIKPYNGEVGSLNIDDQKLFEITLSNNED